MSNYLFAYRGAEMAATEEERQAAMAAWGAWFGELGAAIVDPGNPFGGSSSVNGGGAVGDGAGSGLSGYSVVKADSLAGASELAKGCPALSKGGSVDVYETVEVM
jgi:YCII-related domain